MCSTLLACRPEQVADWLVARSAFDELRLDVLEHDMAAVVAADGLTLTEVGALAGLGGGAAAEATRGERVDAANRTEGPWAIQLGQSDIRHLAAIDFSPALLSLWCESSAALSERDPETYRDVLTVEVGRGIVAVARAALEPGTRAYLCFAG